jgi:regulator of RNase E activity RraB
MEHLKGEWGYYQKPVENNEIYVTTVNLAFQHRAGLRDKFKWMVLVLVNDTHMITNDTRTKTQNLVCGILAESGENILVARTDRPKGTEFWFYADNDVAPLEELRSAFGPNQKVYVDVRLDAAWSGYFLQMLPQAPSQRQQVLNGKALRVLSEQGDLADSPHSIDHLIQFRNEADLSRVEQILAGHGFRKGLVASSDSSIWILNVHFIQEVHQLTLSSINQATINLTALAERVGGKYDGWQTQVVKQ